jgi:hypothetical protein
LVAALAALLMFVKFYHCREDFGGIGITLSNSPAFGLCRLDFSRQRRVPGVAAAMSVSR